MYLRCMYSQDMRQNQPVAETRNRNVRVDDELWEAAQAKAARRRESVSDVIRRALLDYIEEPDGSEPADQPGK